MDFFDRNGSATCYIADGEHIYLWAGKPVAYISDGKVYSFSGKLLGWFENGWLYDRRNQPSLFSDRAVGGPVKPVKKVKPVRGVRSTRPVKAVKSVAHVKPVRSNQWSEYASALYFSQ